MEKKTDFKFIIGMVILVGVLVLTGVFFWKNVVREAEKDLEEEARQEAEAIDAICVEVGDYLKEQVFVDMDTETVFRAEIPTEGIYNRNGKLIQGDVLEDGDMVRIYGDNVLTDDEPACYPGVAKMQRIGRATLEEAEPWQELAQEYMDIIDGKEDVR